MIEPAVYIPRVSTIGKIQAFKRNMLDSKTIESDSKKVLIVLIVI